MVSEARKQSMAWMETDYSKHTYFRWKVEWRLEQLGALGIMDETKYCLLFITIESEMILTEMSVDVQLN